MKIHLPILSFLCCLLCFQTRGQSSMLARTPPMGWNSWNLFEEDVSEQLVKQIADAMSTSGMKEAGYEYIVIDDFWVGGRDAKNDLYADKSRFPSGMKVLADYVHSKGLKLGIYSDASPLTCGGVTGSYNFEQQDANIFAKWGIDYLKYDYCNAPADMATAFERYKKMGDALKKTGRPIVYSICEWGQRKPWLWARAAGGNLWRTTWDIRDTWSANTYTSSSNGILNSTDQQTGLEKYAGPGGWNDPDLLVTGLFGKGKSSSENGRFKGCTLTEYRSQFALWCMMASPLMLNLDIRNLDNDSKRIILDKDLIAINQDTLGDQARSVYKNNGLQIFKKELTGNRYAICILNRGENSSNFSFDLKNELKLNGKWKVVDLRKGKESLSSKQLTGSLQPHECLVYLFKTI
ncbi:MAG: alpha-galactosidase [Bacteroidota bacterium]